MAVLPVVTIANVKVQDNWQHTVRYRCTMTVNNATYPVGGIPIVAALNAALMPTTNNRRPVAVIAVSLLGSGYIYDYIRSTGCLMVLQPPPAASLGTAGPLQQLTSAANSLSGVAADQIQLLVEYDRNASV